MKKITLFLLIALSAFYLAGCSSSVSENIGKEYELNKTWILQSLGLKTADNSNFPQGLPWMTLKVNSISMSGYNGCNTMAGGVHATSDKIFFTNIISTKMYCEGVKEQEFIDALLKANMWGVENGRLILQHNEDVVAEFKEGPVPKN